MSARPGYSPRVRSRRSRPGYSPRFPSRRPGFGGRPRLRSRRLELAGRPRLRSRRLELAGRPRPRSRRPELGRSRLRSTLTGLGADPRLVSWLIALSLGAAGWLLPAAALGQSLEVRGTSGLSSFVDEDFIEHFVVGGSLRIPLSERWSFEPRFAYMRAGERDQDFYLVPDLVYDLRSRGAVTPYLVVGVGVFFHRSGGFGPSGDRTFTGDSWTLGGGGGVRVSLGERWTFSPEARLGFEPFFQVTGSVGYRF